MLRSSAGCIPDCLAKSGRALERLDDQVVGDVAREAEMDGRVDERLHHQEHVGRAGAADRGRHGDHLLVVDLELVRRARRAGRRPGPAARRSSPGVAYQTVMPLPEPGRRVGHAPDDLVVAEDAGQGRGRGAGQDAEDELAAAQVRADLAPDPVEHLGLDAEQDDVGAARRPRRCRRRSGCRTRARAASRRSARGWLATTWPGWTSSPRSRPAIIASAMTPEPTVAIVALRQGGHRPEYSRRGPGGSRRRRGAPSGAGARRRRARRTGRSS